MLLESTSQDEVKRRSSNRAVGYSFVFVSCLTIFCLGIVGIAFIILHNYFNAVIEYGEASSWNGIKKPAYFWEKVSFNCSVNIEQSGDNRLYAMSYSWKNNSDISFITYKKIPVPEKQYSISVRTRPLESIEAAGTGVDALKVMSNLHLNFGRPELVKKTSETIGTFKFTEKQFMNLVVGEFKEGWYWATFDFVEENNRWAGQDYCRFKVYLR